MSLLDSLTAPLASQKPKLVTGPHKEKRYKLKVPFDIDERSWEEHLALAAPNTHQDDRVWGYGPHFRKPKPSKSGHFTLFLATDRTICSGDQALAFCDRGKLWQAGPYHLFGARKLVGNLYDWAKWTRFGLGILAPDMATNTDGTHPTECFALWYRKNADARASVRSTGERFASLTLFAFVGEQW